MTNLHPYYQPFGTITALAHRGFSLDGLENSMAAFQAAVDLGYRYLETDAHGTSDGVAVALHDATLDRTTDGRGAVPRLPWKTVKTAKIGGVEPVPKFEDLLAAWDDVHIQVDVKTRSGIEPIANAIERTRTHDRVCVASFNTRRRLDTVARLSRPVATSAGTSEVAAFLGAVTPGRSGARQSARLQSFQVPVGAGPLRIVSRRFLDRARALGKPVHVWTINDRAQMESLLNMGVDGIITDRADVLKDLLVERGQWGA